jgi:hypothetical protein
MKHRSKLATFATSGATAMLAVLAASATGCKQDVLCPALGSCGGPRDPNGNSLPPIALEVNPPIPQRSQQWILAPGHGSCTEDLYLPAREGRLAGANVPVAGMSAPEPAVFDWCVLLVTGTGTGQACGDPTDPGVCRTAPRFYYESGPIGRASIQYDDTGHWSTGLTRTGTFTLTFPTFCMRAFGAMGSDVATDPASLCKQLEAPVADTGRGTGAEFNTTCLPNSADGRAKDMQDHPGLPPIDGPLDPGGCFCRFDLTETGGPAGDYQILPDQETIIHFPGSNFPQKATFCQQGDTLQLTGAEGAYLFDTAGLRTLDLVRACKSNPECTSGNCVMQGAGASVQGICGS